MIGIGEPISFLKRRFWHTMNAFSYAFCRLDGVFTGSFISHFHKLRELDGCTAEAQYRGLRLFHEQINLPVSLAATGSELSL